MPPTSRNQRANKKVQRTPYERHGSGNNRPYFSALKATFASILRPFTSSWSSNAEAETSNNKRASRSLLDPELNPHYLGRTPHIVRINNRSHIRTLDGVEGKSSESDLPLKQNTQIAVENKYPVRRDSKQLDFQPLKQHQFASERKLHPPPLTSSSAALLDILRSIRTNPGAGDLSRSIDPSQKSTGHRSEQKIPSRRNERRSSSSKRERPQSPDSEFTNFDADKNDDQIRPSYSSTEQPSSTREMDQPKGVGRTEPYPKKTKREEPNGKSLKELRKEKLRQELIPIVYETLERIDLKKQKQVNVEVQTEEQPGNPNSVNKQDFVSQYEYSAPSGSNKRRVRAAFSALDEDLDELFDKDEDSALSVSTSHSTKKHEPFIAGSDKKPPKTLLPRSGPTFEQLQSSLSPKRTQPTLQESAIALPTDIPGTSEKDTNTPKTSDSATQISSKREGSQPADALKRFAIMSEKNDTAKLPESSSGNIPKFEFKPVTKNAEDENKDKDNDGQNKSAGFSFGNLSDSSNKTFGQTTLPAEKPSVPQKPFTFGQPAEKDSSQQTVEAPKLSFNFKAAQTDESKQAPAPSFNFGQKSEEKEPKEDNKASFSFGLPSQQQLPKSATPSFTFGEASGNKSAESSSKSPFSFGQLPSSKKTDELQDKLADSTSVGKKDSDVPKLNFTFGQQSEKKEPSNPKPAFSFGQSGTAASLQSPEFSFNKPSTDQKDAGSTSGPFANAAPAMKTETPKFSFGQTAVQNNTRPKNGEEKNEQVPKPAFSFGQSLKTDEKSETAKPSFSFGTSSSKDENKESTVPTTDTNTMKPAFSFGQSGGLTTSTANKAAFSFGGPQKKDDATENEKPSTSIFSFSKPSEDAKDNANLSNKTASEAKPATPIFSFGSNTTPSALNPTEKQSPFSTGIPGSTTNTLAINKENTGPFGKTEPNEQEKTKPFIPVSTEKPFSFSKTEEPQEKQTTAPPATPFTFGSVANPPTSAFGSGPSNTAIGDNGGLQSSAFSFNNNNSGSAPGFGMSNTASTKPPKTSNTSAPSAFGSSLSQPNTQPAGAFGSTAFGNLNSPFASQPNTDSNGPNPGSGFGNVTQAPSTGFTFGASGNTIPSAFGAAKPSGFNTNIGNTTPSFNFGSPQPSNPPNAGFSFGGTGTPAFSAGSSAAQSPAPQPQGGIQFNLGSTNEQPNPPAGRKIAVPRSRRKR
ncbi:nucleoporin Nup124 [Schizosaccharomyces octosporus yFS286]|uniref:Nucleoporin Nup124 n=1 Tax=Schizosaccharomyces octosporus (strain yFS286) TaxID=483514 RepID=S9Q3Q7_SCHOY|nr:nucleoporin Nup124 [Schizosaccharomyces octosporus yFS286]EPX74707.1 nucleoporin Nup124 [Schizosaccharomyces octosporus yFS286]